MPNYLNTQILPVRDPITYSRPPLPPAGEAAWLNKTISQPYFPAIDINPYKVSTLDPGTYFKPPPPVTFSVNTIAQPISVIQVQKLPHIVPVSTYFTSPVPVASWLSRSIYQPYILPYNELLYGISPVNVGTYFQPPSVIFITKSTIAQPQGMQVFPIPRVRDPMTFLPPLENMGFLTNNIQPYITPYNTNFYVRISPMFRILLTRLLLGIGI